jgi:hypothetical protein
MSIMYLPSKTKYYRKINLKLEKSLLLYKMDSSKLIVFVTHNSRIVKMFGPESMLSKLIPLKVNIILNI